MRSEVDYEKHEENGGGGGRVFGGGKVAQTLLSVLKSSPAGGVPLFVRGKGTPPAGGNTLNRQECLCYLPYL